MRILQLCKKYPYPAKDGESIAILALATSLHQLGCEIDLLAMNTIKHHSVATAETLALPFYKNIQVVDMDTRIRPLAAFTNLFSSASYHISRFVANDFKEKLEQILQAREYDIIQLETLYLVPYIATIRENSKAKIVLRSHNVEHEIWERITQNTSNPIKKWYLHHLTQKLKRYEIGELQSYDFLAAITPRDLAYFEKLGYSKEGVSIPIGIHSADYQADFETVQGESVAFIGSLDWMPNVEGLKWFLKECWGNIKKNYPQIICHIAGRNPITEIQNWQQDGVQIHGEVEDAKAFINAHSIILVPLLSGSGMRVKILEAMALGRVVITTSLGLEGIHARHQKEILIADTPSEWEAAIRFCMEHPARKMEIAHQAQQFIQAEFDDMAIARKLLQAYQKVVS